MTRKYVLKHLLFINDKANIILLDLIN